MSVKHLVLEIEQSESAADLQKRLDNAEADGFFLVNVVGRFAFLRTSVVQQWKDLPVVTDAEMPVNEDALAQIRKALKSCRADAITLQDLRRRAGFQTFQNREWYRALDKLETLGEIAKKKHVSSGGRTRLVVEKVHAA